jgi:hypothetical protein
MHDYAHFFQPGTIDFNLLVPERPGTWFKGPFFKP